jgi:salicylate hydroxylase
MDSALITGIYFRDPLETWGSDRVTLLGDAAHPAPPSAGQGAGMALEDAVMLAACLRRAGTGNERAALREYEFRRQSRTRRMLESSRVNLRNSQTSDPVQVRARNGYYRGLARLSPAGPPCRNGYSRTTRSPPPGRNPRSSRGTWPFPATRCAGQSHGGPSTCGGRR